MKVLLLFIAGFFAVLLQNTVFNVLAVAGGKPDFILIFIVFFAIFRGPIQGGLLGMGLGLLEDLIIGRFIGINALCKGFIGYLAGTLEKRLYKNNFLVPMVALVAATFVQTFLYWLLSCLIGSVVGLDKMLLVAIPDSIYNMCFAPIIYAIFYHINQKNKNQE